jgi:hypothetical protein
MVGMTGFEPMAFASRNATLYQPKPHPDGADDRDRTCTAAEATHGSQPCLFA